MTAGIADLLKPRTPTLLDRAKIIQEPPRAPVDAPAVDESKMTPLELHLRRVTLNVPGAAQAFAAALAEDPAMKAEAQALMATITAPLASRCSVSARTRQQIIAALAEG